MLNLFLFVLCRKYNTALLDWQRKKIHAQTIYNGCLQYTSFQVFCLESSIVSSETWISYQWSTEITCIINQPFLQVFGIFIRHVSLLQCLIVILWLDLKMARLKFLSCIFKYIRMTFFIWSYSYSSKDLIWEHDQKPRGEGSCPVNPAQEKLSSSHTTPRRHLTSLSLARENTQTGVLFPVLKEVTQKYLLLRCINFSSLQRMDRDASISTASGTESPAILDEQSPFIRERKGIPALGI